MAHEALEALIARRDLSPPISRSASSPLFEYAEAREHLPKGEIGCERASSKQKIEIVRDRLSKGRAIRGEGGHPKGGEMGSAEGEDRGSQSWGDRAPLQPTQFKCLIHLSPHMQIQILHSQNYEPVANRCGPQ